MNMRDLQSTPGVWFPTGMDAVGVESWAIKVPAKVVKDEVGYQFKSCSAKLAIVKANIASLDEMLGDRTKPEALDVVFCDWWCRYRIEFERDQEEAKPKVDFWEKWNTYLASMPDDELLSLTKADYETFFADRDQRESGEA
ncbi:MAG: hypothetical protein P4L67_05090 [Candidatus Pacebacteria bacterium]|nr:hypothetical protein [Candidatus Paceibacterota bacterium]